MFFFARPEILEIGKTPKDKTAGFSKMFFHNHATGWCCPAEPSFHRHYHGTSVWLMSFSQPLCICGRPMPRNTLPSLFTSWAGNLRSTSGNFRQQRCPFPIQHYQHRVTELFTVPGPCGFPTMAAVRETGPSAHNNTTSNNWPRHHPNSKQGCDGDRRKFFSAVESR